LSVAPTILQHDGFGVANFLRHIVREGLARHAARQAPYPVHDDRVSGLGIWAIRAIAGGEIIFRGEERSQRIATRRWVGGTGMQMTAARLRKWLSAVR